MLVIIQWLCRLRESKINKEKKYYLIIGWSSRLKLLIFSRTISLLHHEYFNCGRLIIAKYLSNLTLYSYYFIQTVHTRSIISNINRCFNFCGTHTHTHTHDQVYSSIYTYCCKVFLKKKKNVLRRERDLLLLLLLYCRVTWCEKKKR